MFDGSITKVSIRATPSQIGNDPSLARKSDSCTPWAWSQNVHGALESLYQSTTITRVGEQKVTCNKSKKRTWTFGQGPAKDVYSPQGAIIRMTLLRFDDYGRAFTTLLSL